MSHPNQVRGLSQEALAQIIATGQPGPGKIDALNQLSWLSRRSEIQRSLQLAQTAHEAACALDYTSGKAYAMLNLAFHDYTSQGKIEQSISSFLEAIGLFESLGDDYGAGLTHSLLSYIYWTSADYEQGFYHLMEGADYQKKSGNREGEAWDMFNFGTFYSELHYYEEAAPYFTDAIALFEELEEYFGLASSMLGLAVIEQAHERYTEAKARCERALELARTHDYADTRAWGYLILSEIYQSMGAYAQAVRYAEDSLQTYRATGDQQGEVNAELQLGLIYCDTKEPAKSLEYLAQVEAHALAANARQNLIKAHNHMAIIYDGEGNLAESLRHYKAYVKLKEEVMGDQSANQMSKMQAVFNVKQARQETEIERLRNVELAAAYREIEQQQDKILSSIRYAKRIQDAVLPDTRRLHAQFSASFLFFRPKDIVSGDFYWYHAVPDGFMVAAIDCTGHGVPGAFMVLMGTALLNDIILKDGITDPELVLTELDKRLLHSLQSEGEHQRNDGMDMALLHFNPDRSQVRFAGAKNPLLLVRDAEPVLYKGSKFPIGSQQFRKPKEFPATTISLQRGDCLYLYSDGYPDQFGGERQTKYLSKRFRQLLLEHHGKAMQEQAGILATELDAWIGEGKQTDDIIVMGLRV